MPISEVEQMSLTEIAPVASIDDVLKGGANESAQRPSLPLFRSDH